MILLIDNYDSFTFNLFHLLGELGAACEVRRNDAITVEQALAMAPEAIVLSPGPCTPDEAGICLDLIAAAAGRVPVLGVCLGHQAIGQAFGGEVQRAPTPMHGKVGRVEHAGTDMFAGLPSPFDAARYHSLIVERTPCRPSWRPPPGPRTGWSWACATAPCRSSACSSTRRASPPSTAATSWPTSWRSPAAPTRRAAPPDPRVDSNLKPVIARLARGETLAEAEAEAAFGLIMSGEATPAQIAGMLMAMRLRGETVAELAGAVRAMRARMVAVPAPPGAIDVCGTGGDGPAR